MKQSCNNQPCRNVSRSKEEIENSIKAVRSTLESVKNAARDNCKELEEQIKAIEEGLKSKPNETTRLEKLGFYEPEEGEDYYYNNNNYEIKELTYNNHGFDGLQFKLGNSFKTRKAAEAAAKRNEIRADLLMNSKEWSYDENNYCLEYSNSLKSWELFCYTNYQRIMHYFTKEKAQEMINKWGDDLNLLNV